MSTESSPPQLTAPHTPPSDPQLSAGLRLKTYGVRSWQWLTQDRHKKQAVQLRDDIERAFTDHPREAGETYFEHLWYTMRLSSRFAMISAAIIIHGIFPFLCTRTASRQVDLVYKSMKNRVTPANIDNAPMPADNNATLSVVIIGGGFSGLMALAHLVRRGEAGLAIHWFAPGKPGQGVAYGTTNPRHLLNVRANHMGAFADAPQGFWQWLCSDSGKQASARIAPAIKIAENGFMPRTLYAEYLQQIWNETEGMAKRKAIFIHHHDVAAHAVEGQKGKVRILQADGIERVIPGSALIVATGNQSPKPLAAAASLHQFRAHYVHNRWSAEFPSREELAALPTDATLFIIGCGLTMVDAVISLESRGYKGNIMALSRHGLLPLKHETAQPYPAWEWTQQPDRAPRRVGVLLAGLRREIRRANAQGYDWRSVMDSLRPVTTQLWQQLGDDEKKRFNARLLTMWNAHRHRMAPEIADYLEKLKDTGRLHIIAGKLIAINENEQGLMVQYQAEDSNQVSVPAARIINCTGPSLDVRTSQNPLIKDLLQTGAWQRSLLGMGIDSDSAGRAKGNMALPIYPMGNLLVGDRLECTAVPELRQQAQHIADAILRDAFANAISPADNPAAKPVAA